VKLTPASSITGTNYRMKGTGAFSVVTSGGAPTVYTFQVANCLGPFGPIYSLSSVLEVGIQVFLNPQLTVPATYLSGPGDPFNLVGEPLDVGYAFVINNLNGLVGPTNNSCS